MTHDERLVAGEDRIEELEAPDPGVGPLQIDCSRVFGVEDQYGDEHSRARDMTVSVVDHQSGVPIHVYGVVPKMSLTPGRNWRGAASIGEDTTDILSTMLGLSEPQITALYDDRIVHRTEPFGSAQVEPAHR